MRSLSKEQRIVVDRGLSSFFKHGVNSPQTAYVLGAFVTDGTCGLLTHACRNDTRNGSFVKWKQKCTDYRWVQKLSKTVCQTESAVPVVLTAQLFPGSGTPIGCIHSSDVYLRNRSLSADLSSIVELHEGETKAFDLRFPDIPDDLLPHFIRGVHDGDGCLSLSKRGDIRVQFSSGSPQFLACLRRKIIEHCFNGDEVSHVIRSSTCFRLDFAAASSVERFLRWIYQDSEDLFLDRKHSRSLLTQNLLHLSYRDRGPLIEQFREEEQRRDQKTFAHLTQQALHALQHSLPSKTLVSLEDPLLCFSPSFLRYAQSTQLSNQ